MQIPAANESDLPRSDTLPAIFQWRQAGAGAKCGSLTAKKGLNWRQINHNEANIHPPVYRHQADSKPLYGEVEPLYIEIKRSTTAEKYKFGQQNKYEHKNKGGRGKAVRSPTFPTACLFRTLRYLIIF